MPAYMWWLRICPQLLSSFRNHWSLLATIACSGTFSIWRGSHHFKQYHLLSGLLGRTGILDFRASLIDVNPNMPLLGSLALWEALGLVLDLAHGRAHFTALGLYDVPLNKASNGHLVVAINQWPLDQSGFPDEIFDDVSEQEVNLPRIECRPVKQSFADQNTPFQRSSCLNASEPRIFTRRCLRRP